METKWRIEIPWYKAAIQGKETYIVFTLRVYYEDVKWTIDKRFSECFKLSEDLNRKYEGVPEFPTRQPIKLLHDPKFLQTRQRELETYFKSFEQGAFATDEMKNFLNAFTELHKLGYEITPETPHLLPFRNQESVFCAVINVPTSSGFILPQRMTVIKLTSGEILIYAPVQIDDALNYEILRLGKVSGIIVPNKLHLAFLAEYMQRFPEAKVWVPPGFKPEKNSPVDVSEKAQVIQAEAQNWPEDLVTVLTVGNSFFTEVLLYHKGAKVLIVADFIINLPSSVFSAENQITPEASMYTILTTQLFPPSPGDDKPKCSPEHAKYCTNAKEYSALIDRLLSLDFNYIIMCYGEIIDNPQSKNILKSACQTVLKDVEERWSVTNSIFSFLGSNK